MLYNGRGPLKQFTLSNVSFSWSYSAVPLEHAWTLTNCSWETTTERPVGGGAGGAGGKLHFSIFWLAVNQARQPKDPPLPFPPLLPRPRRFHVSVWAASGRNPTLTDDLVAPGVTPGAQPEWRCHSACSWTSARGSRHQQQAATCIWLCLAAW